jgi:hypothetical protein
VGVKLSISATVTATGETTVFNAPDPYIAFLRRLTVSNGATETALVQVIFYNGGSAKPVLAVRVPAGSNITLGEDELPLEACPTRISISTDQQPLNVSLSIELE